MIVVSDLADFNRIFLVTLKAHIDKKYFEPIWFKLLSLWVILWTLEEDCFGCCDDGLCRRDTATIKTLGQFGGAGTKSMGGSFYSTLYKCELGLYNIVWDTKETMDR